jgi:protein O-GlcNAc transferase
MGKKNRRAGVPVSDRNALSAGERALSSGRFSEAISHLSRIPKNSNDYSRACKGLGAALLRSGKVAESLDILQTAHEAFPNDADILVDAGDAARVLCRTDVAETVYARARELGANGFQIRFGEASILQQRKLWLEAIDAWTALHHEFPNDTSVTHNLGKAWHELGETDRAITLLREAYEASREPQTLAVLALLAPHAAICDHTEVRRWRTKYGDWLRSVEKSTPVDPVEHRSRDRISIGYVSAFFHRPNWMKPVWALLNNHDRDRFKIHLFADGPTDEIDTEGGYRANERDGLIDTRELSNVDLAQLIRRHEIDVLVDLNGYSAMPRLRLWASKPAPVTIGWFNYYATSGMLGIEWLIGDDVVIRREEEEFYTEKIVRLQQSYLTFQVGYKTPDIEIPSADAPFTFGCLGSAYKITPEVRDAWISLLRKTDSTRLIVRNRVLGEERHREWLMSFFTDAGIGAERLVLLGPAPHDEFLRTYGKIDLALDTFPYNGGTTTMEALWQGVPVVCFNGDRWVSRTSATIVKSAALGEFVGSCADDYVEIAAKWSSLSRRDELRQMRKEMRERLVKSSVCDGGALARDFERIVTEILEGPRD